MNVDNEKIGVTTTPLPDGMIIQEVFTIHNSENGSIRETIMRQVLDTREKQIIDALIQLGWTPPGA